MELLLVGCALSSHPGVGIGVLKVGSDLLGRANNQLNRLPHKGRLIAGRPVESTRVPEEREDEFACDALGNLRTSRFLNLIEEYAGRPDPIAEIAGGAKGIGAFSDWHGGTGRA